MSCLVLLFSMSTYVKTRPAKKITLHYFTSVLRMQTKCCKRNFRFYFICLSRCINRCLCIVWCRCLPCCPCLSVPSNWLMLAKPSISGGIVSVQTRQMLSRHDVTSMFDTEPLCNKRARSNKYFINNHKVCNWILKFEINWMLCLQTCQCFLNRF